MQIKLVERTESIEFVINGKFIFCKELSKGFVKTDLTPLNIDDYSFENVVSIIEGLDYNSIETSGVNSVEFGNNYSENKGQILISQRTEEKLKFELQSMDSDLARADFIEARRSNRKYFDIDNLTVDTVSNSSQMIV